MRRQKKKKKERERETARRNPPVKHSLTGDVTGK